MKRHVAIVIPAFQEEHLVGVTLRGLPDWVSTIIVVDDASTDQTRAVVEQVIKEKRDTHTNIILKSLPENQGVGRAICIGYEMAKQSGAEVAVVMGADAQMDPTEIIDLLHALTPDLAYVKGNRMRHPEVRQRMPKLRYWGNRILSVITGWIINYPELEDAQCGFTALDLKWLEQLPLQEIYPRYGFPNDLLMRIHAAGGEIAQVNVTPIYGEERSTLSVPRVIFPLLGVLLRGVIRKYTVRVNPSRHSLH